MTNPEIRQWQKLPSPPHPTPFSGAQILLSIQGRKLPLPFKKCLPFSHLPVPGRDLVRSRKGSGEVLDGKKHLLKMRRSNGEKGRGTVTFFPDPYLGINTKSQLGSPKLAMNWVRKNRVLSRHQTFIANITSKVWGPPGVDFGVLAQTPLWAAKSGLCYGGSRPRGRPCGRRFRGAPGRPDLCSQILPINLGGSRQGLDLGGPNRPLAELGPGLIWGPKWPDLGCF